MTKQKIQITCHSEEIHLYHNLYRTAWMYFCNLFRYVLLINGSERTISSHNDFLKQMAHQRNFSWSDKVETFLQ